MERMASTEIVDCELGTLVGQRVRGLDSFDVQRKPIVSYAPITVTHPTSRLQIPGVEIRASGKRFHVADLKGPTQPDNNAMQALRYLNRDLDYIHRVITGVRSNQLNGRDPDLSQKWQSATDDLAQKIAWGENFIGPQPEHPGYVSQQATQGWTEVRDARDFPIHTSPRQNVYEEGEIALPGKYFLRNNEGKLMSFTPVN